MGGPLFMGILTLLLAITIVVFVRTMLQNKNNDMSAEHVHSAKHLIHSLGLLSVVIGVLGTLIGLYTAFATIELSGGVSQEILAGGLKVALITPMYGLIIYGLSVLMKLALK